MFSCSYKEQADRMFVLYTHSTAHAEREVLCVANIYINLVVVFQRCPRWTFGLVLSTESTHIHTFQPCLSYTIFTTDKLGDEVIRKPELASCFGC